MVSRRGQGLLPAVNLQITESYPAVPMHRGSNYLQPLGDSVADIVTRTEVVATLVGIASSPMAPYARLEAYHGKPK